MRVELRVKCVERYLRVAEVLEEAEAEAEAEVKRKMKRKWEVGSRLRGWFV